MKDGLNPTHIFIDEEFDMNLITQMVNKDHRNMVDALLKPGSEVLASLSPHKVDLAHAVLGISGEAGELLDCIKKHVFYSKPLDRDNVIEELGDLEFYMEALRNKLGITREETLKQNMEKLAVRYKGLKYSDQAAIDRADKNESLANPHTDLPQ